jgi:hypothetical protein
MHPIDTSASGERLDWPNLTAVDWAVALLPFEEVDGDLHELQMNIYGYVCMYISWMYVYAK